MKATIEIRYPDGHTEGRTLEDETIVFGRSEGDVTLLDPKVSGRHAALSVGNNRVTYTDLESTNGSAMDDGTPVSGAVVLLPGQGVVLGACRVGLVSVELPPIPANPPAPAPKGGDQAFAGTIVANPGLQMPAGPPRADAAPDPPRAAAAPEPAPPPPAAAPDPAPAAAPDPAPAAAPDPAPAAAPDPPAPSTPAAPPAPAAAAEPPAPSPAVDPQPATAPQPSAASDNVWNDVDAAANAEDASEAPDAPWSMATVPPGSAADDNAPLGVPVGRAGEGMKDFGTQLKARLTTTWKRLEPHLMIIGKFVAMVTVPFAAVQVVLGFIPVAGLLLSIPLSLLEAAVVSLVVTGVVADYTLKVHRGEQASVSASMKAHMARIVPWAITMVLAGIMGFIGFFLFIVPAIMVSWATVPAFMVEDRRMLDAPMRGARLFMKDWLHVLQVLAVGIIGMFPIYVGLAFLSVMPGISTLAPLVSALAQAFLIPFGMLYSYGAFFETRKRVENAGLQPS